MSKRIIFSSIVSVGLALASNSASAAGNTGFYIGGGLGAAVVDVSELQFSERDMAFKVLAGYMFSDFIGVEASYFDGGDPKEEFGIDAVMVSTQGYSGSLVLRARTGSQIVLFGKVGFAKYNFEVTQLTDSQPTSIESRTDTDLSYGIGINYNFRERFLFRAEYETASVSGTDFQLLSFVAGVQF